MSIEKAKAHYTGKALPRLNCAEAVAHAFKEKFKLTDDDLARFGFWGGGKAPEGECGSLHAARVLQAKLSKEGAPEQAFLSLAGSTKCRDIRKSGKISCVKCVELMADYVDKL